MKRLTSSINNKQDAKASQSKRFRSSTPVHDEESGADYMGKGSDSNVQNKKKVINNLSQNSKRKKSGGHKRDDNNNSQITASTPSGSSISFDSSSSSLSRRTNRNKENNLSSKTSSSSKEKGLRVTRDISDVSNLSANKRASSPSSNKKKNVSDKHNSSQRPTTDSRFTTDQKVSPSLSYLNDSKPTFPIHSLVEGSLEYRELKRLHLQAKEQVEEWRKDYNVLKQQVVQLKSSTIPRPTAEVLDWVEELFDIMKNNGAFTGDGRSLTKIGQDLGLNEASLITVAARTPQKSALKLFRLLYPTVGSRANCGSISKVPQRQLENIYQYVRGLHKNLNFTRTDMRKAIGTSIRSATCELRKLERRRQQQLNTSQSDENVGSDESDQRMNATNNVQVLLDEAADVTDGDNDADENEDVCGDDNDKDDEEDNLLIDDEMDEDDD